MSVGEVAGTKRRKLWLCRFAAERIKQRQERSIGGVREGLAEGGEALGKGFYRGVTGLVSKPVEGAQSRGISGFVQVRGCHRMDYPFTLSLPLHSVSALHFSTDRPQDLEMKLHSNPVPAFS